jgi:ribosomal protein S18 acetylase RimI-like enzyme
MLLIPPDPVWVSDWLEHEQPGYDAIVGHVLATGHGHLWVDRTARPRAVLAETGGNYLLTGNPEAIDPADLRPLITGFLATPSRFLPLLHAAFEQVIGWDRLVYASPDVPLGSQPEPDDRSVRRLIPADTAAVRGLHPDMAWISKTWDGPGGLAGSGHGWGAFHDGDLVAVACTFFAGARHHELGVATHPDHRRRGLATACAWHAMRHAASSGRIASWSTSRDNHASQRMADKLGFTLVRHDALYAIGIRPPQP